QDDVLSLLLMARDEDGSAMTDLELRDELMTLLFAGHETTASVLAWAIYWIHSQPEVKQKVMAELSDLGTDPDPMEVAKLPYLTAVCNEALRIYPVVLFTFGRILKQSHNFMGYHLEPGIMLAPCIYLLHHNPKLYPEPKTFRPERFLERQFSPYEFIPFGGSNRRCLGYTFALFELKVVLAKMLSSAKLELASDRPAVPVRRGVTFMPSEGVPVRLQG
ncbi:MAG: cytochrome P450, partial [Cyanobacteria bacterium P01_A01_bin.17]